MIQLEFLVLACVLCLSSAFHPRVMAASSKYTCLKSTTETSNLYVASSRRTTYKTNLAKYLVDLHDSRATFDFCGGMMFEFALSDKLRSRLLEVAGSENASNQPVVADSSKRRMHQLEDYEKSAHADNISYFHGREIRNVPDAAGGRGFVLQLSDSVDDPEGWSAQEVSTYDGWGHDSGRQWRKTDDWESEGVKMREKFGESAFGLNHRFYLHYDDQDNFWLSAEDGCEGKAAEAKRRGYFQGLFN
ncbi:hypothetical protein TrLO_g4267 [Triparma laevis f. longispina]|uniref:Uncharacterized protein n=1 Tax=Triparma laevis f. longispina TaxID=1714387 RepID=A0A9W7DKN8_9STRA|nr:hypothetical protein TrLO_g4267 [Triparma laevis f. longispina]